MFNLGLTAGEQAQFDAILAGLAPGAQIFAGLAASFGCSPAPCIGAANDGADSFLAFQQVPGPIVGRASPGSSRVASRCSASAVIVAGVRRNELGVA